MKITVANRDRTADLGAAVRTTAQARRQQGPQPISIDPEISALRLRQAASDTEYLEILIRLMRRREDSDTRDFEILRKGGRLGPFVAAAKKFLWKLLRYQHARMAFQQNLFNEMAVSALEYEAVQRRREIESLGRRVAVLEARVKNSP